MESKSAHVPFQRFGHPKIVMQLIKALISSSNKISPNEGLIPGSRRFPGGGCGNPLQYSCLENSMDRGTWRAAVHGVQRVGHDWSDLERSTHKTSRDRRFQGSFSDSTGHEDPFSTSSFIFRELTTSSLLVAEFCYVAEYHTLLHTAERSFSHSPF